MGIFFKSVILHTPKFHLHTLSCHFWLNLCADGFEMMHKAWNSVEEVPYLFLRSSMEFQGHMCRKIYDLNPIWVRLLCRSQLSNPSDLPCLILFVLYTTVYSLQTGASADVWEFNSWRNQYYLHDHNPRKPLLNWDNSWVSVGDRQLGGGRRMLPQMLSKSLPTQLFVQWLIQANLKESIKLCTTGPFWGEPPVTGGFPSQRASDAESVSMLRFYHLSDEF